MGVTVASHATNLFRFAWANSRDSGTPAPTQLMSFAIGDGIVLPWRAIEGGRTPFARIFDQALSNCVSASLMNLPSAGLVPGPPAKCPQIEGTGSNFAFGMLATSNSLSAGGK